MDFDDPDNTWLFGLFLNIFGSVMVNFGTNLMKSAHNIALKTPSDNVKPTIFTSKNIWTLGMTIFVVGSLVNFASFAFAAQSLLAALGTVQFISNVIFAKFILNEKLTPRILVATVIIIVGLVIAIICSNHNTEVYTTHDLLELYTTDYIMFMLFLLIILIVLHVTYVIYTTNEHTGTPLPGNGIVRPSTYAIVSATVGTQSVLQSKCLAELIKATINGENQFNKPFVYIIVLVFALGLSFWLYRMNAALKKFDGLIIIPLLQVFWTTSAILQGGVYFQEFVKFKPQQTVGFLSGVVIVFIGVYLLTPKDDMGDGAKLLAESSGHSTDTNGDMDTSTSHLTKNGHISASTHSHRYSGLLSTSMHGLHGVDNSSHLMSLTFMPVVIESVPHTAQQKRIQNGASLTMRDIELGKGVSSSGDGSESVVSNDSTTKKSVSSDSNRKTTTNSRTKAPVL